MKYNVRIIDSELQIYFKNKKDLTYEELISYLKEIEETVDEDLRIWTPEEVIIRGIKVRRKHNTFNVFLTVKEVIKYEW